jgi:PTS system galactitol-specific IIA component
MATTNLLRLLVPAATSFHLKADTSTEVITHLSRLLFEAGYVQPSFAEAVIAREKELPTGLPLNGQTNAAIPHTDVEHVLKPGLALATLTTPVTFQNMTIPEESVVVQLVIVLALNQPEVQIEMLQGVAELLQQPKVVSRIMEADNFGDLKTALSGS